MADQWEPDDGNTVHLGDEAAAQVRRIAETFDITRGEVVRRGLSMVQMWASLAVNQTLAIYNEDTGKLEACRFHWGRLRTEGED